MSEIISVHAREILDSRGTPTIEVEICLSDGSSGRASVPSGASTGIHETVEKRDKDATRFGGRGVLSAIQSVEEEIAPVVWGRESLNQRLIDNLMVQLDGTSDKSQLGANAILGVSLAVAKAAAQSVHLPLYRYIGGVNAHILPVPMMNILNGGQHADNALDIQEFMIMPIGATSCHEAVRMGCEIFMALKSGLKQAGLSTNVGDEGGFAPQLSSTIEALDFIIKAVETAGYHVGSDVALALDVAASSLYDGHTYHLAGEKRQMSGVQLVDYYEHLSKNYPIISIEDGMAEDDFTGWKLLTKRLGKRLQLVGDDLFTTNSMRLKIGIKEGMANAILIKPNQIGTLTETLDAVEMAQKSGYAVILSHRSGETEDTTIADLAVATNCGQIKAGSLSRTDRLAKYNQLLRLEEDLGSVATFYYWENDAK